MSENIFLFVPNLIVLTFNCCDCYGCRSDPTAFCEDSLTTDFCGPSIALLYCSQQWQNALKTYGFSQPVVKNAFRATGYSRILLTLISFYYMPTNYMAACWCYIISGLLDAFDGHAARYFDQSTKFGAMLDQLTDRCGTMCLLVTLSYFYPHYMFLFQLSMTIDIACHWIHLHTTLLQGKTSHKFFDLSDNPVMRIYYTSRTVLFFMCAGNEAFYASLYLLHFTEGPIVLGIGIFRLICYISAPVAIVKSLIALLQGYIACRNLGAVDVREREALRAKAK